MWSSPNRLAPLVLLGWLSAAAAPIGFRTQALPIAALDAPYRAVLDTFVDGRCIDGGAGFAVVDGALPPGLELQGNTITGLAAQFGSFPVRLQVTNECGADVRDFVIQVTGRPILHVTPERIDLEYRLGGPPPDVHAVLVSATWPMFRYSTTKGPEPWLHVRQQTGITPAPGSPYRGDAVEVRVTPESLAPGSYETSLVFSGPQGAVPVTVPVRLRVIASAPPAATTPAATTPAAAAPAAAAPAATTPAATAPTATAPAATTPAATTPAATAPAATTPAATIPSSLPSNFLAQSTV